MGNQFEDIKNLIDAWDTWFEGRYRSLAQRDLPPAIELWALTKHHEIHQRLRGILHEALAEADHGPGH